MVVNSKKMHCPFADVSIDLRDIIFREQQDVCF